MDYINPIKRHGDFADPYVMRYNGRYYLYATNPDVRCWSSDDLLCWKAEGPAIGPEEFPGLVPFAPEVVYHNGAFYMYTSPSGLGHYVLKSTSPTGPFHRITGNLGHNIDGSVFIDDDGQWYFYWADDEGIMCCRMSAPDTFGEPINTGAFMHGWTEGPMVVKEGGLYYMTYTGNHYLSAGYRINAAVSQHPQGPYRDCENNPILVHTTGKNVGLGHSSTVLGPDLFTRYIVYHNLNPDRTRDLDLDVIELRGGRVQVAGPSRTEQPAPAAPSARYDPEADGFAQGWTVTDGSWEREGECFVSRGDTFRCEKRELPHAEALELNLFSKAACYGVDLGEAELRFDAGENSVSLLGSRGEAMGRSELPEDYEHGALHCVLLRRRPGRLEIFLDGRSILGAELHAPIAALGLFARGGSLGVGRCTVAGKACESPYFPTPCHVRAAEKLRLNVTEGGEHLLAVMMEGECGADASLTWTCDGQENVCGPILRSRDCAVYRLTLSRGLHDIRMSFSEHCRPVWYSLRREPAGAAFSGAFTLPGTVGKTLADAPETAEVAAELRLPESPCEPGAEAGLMFRASELAKGGEGDDERLGINFFIGYCASLSNGFLVLTKHRYDRRELARVPAPGRHSLTVRAELNDIRVYLDRNALPAITFHDPDPILYGRVGVRAVDFKLKDAYLEVN